MSDCEFCKFCGAGIGKHRREHEGTCPRCDPKGGRKHVTKIWKKQYDEDGHMVYEAANGETAWIIFENCQPVVLRAFNANGTVTYVRPEDESSDD